LKKQAFIRSLETFLASGQITMKGQRELAAHYIHYFRKTDIAADRKYDFWKMEAYLPQLMLDGFMDLLSSEDRVTASIREQLREETSHLMLGDPSKIGAIPATDQVLWIQSIDGILRGVGIHEITCAKVEAMFTAEIRMVELAFRRFVQEVFCTGLYEVINSGTSSGMHATFGADRDTPTTLRTFVSAGRIMFTFACEGVLGEDSITFVGTEDDPLLLSAGLQSVDTSLATALQMFDTVRSCWPAEPEQQAASFTVGGVLVV
jgi:hypothetical protein